MKAASDESWSSSSATDIVGSMIELVVDERNEEADNNFFLDSKVGDGR